MARQGRWQLSRNCSYKRKSSQQNRFRQETKAEAIVRPYVQRLADNACVSTGVKIALGLNPRTSGRTPSACPFWNIGSCLVFRRCGGYNYAWMLGI